MYESGTATDYLDLAAKLNTFLTAKGSAFSLSYSGTGDGTFGAYSGGASSVAEVFTITATTATNFTVVGSVTGSIGPATVGTPFAHATIEFTITAGGTPFVSGDVFQISTAPKWTALLSPVVATATRWRVSITDTEGGGSTWYCAAARVEMMTTRGGADQCSGGTAVASSENGTHVADDAFDTDSATYWQATSIAGWIEYQFAATKAIKEVAITFPTAISKNYGPKDFTVEYHDGSKWVIAGTWREETERSAAERRTYQLAPYIWQAPGNDGTSEILVGIHPFENGGVGSYNWRLQGLTAYEALSDFHSQPGAISSSQPYGPVLPLSNASLGYWFIANGRRVTVVVKTGSIYGAAYLGLIQPYASPGQWPYPLFVGGSLWWDTEPDSDDSRWFYGTTSDFHTVFAKSFLPQLLDPSKKPVSSSARLRKPDGSWASFCATSDFYDTREETLIGTVWPYAYGFLNLKPDLSGNYGLFPIILFEHSPVNVYGQLDGVMAVSGSGLSAEASITEGIDSYIAFPDVSRNGAGDYFAVKLD